jgi:hypothetical protein
VLRSGGASGRRPVPPRRSPPRLLSITSTKSAFRPTARQLARRHTTRSSFSVSAYALPRSPRV